VGVGDDLRAELETENDCDVLAGLVGTGVNVSGGL
jgi:hypothetical protein